LVGRPEGKRQLRRSRSRWAENLKMDVREAGCGGVDWLGLALVTAVMNLQVP
jgi:hypothetical protein